MVEHVVLFKLKAEATEQGRSAAIEALRGLRQRIEGVVEVEGSWEEVVAEGGGVAGRRVRVTVVDAAENGQGDEAMSPAERFAAAMRELEADQEMPFTPGGDGVAIIREGRAGAMYGYN